LLSITLDSVERLCIVLDRVFYDVRIDVVVKSFRDRPFILKGEGEGLWFFVSFRMFFSDNTRVRIIFFCRAKREIFFPEFNIRLYDKSSESDYFFFLHQNQTGELSNLNDLMTKSIRTS
jgi:hypothetical protein